MSRTGLSLCFLYVLASATLISVGWFVADDVKSRYVFMQGPVMLQAALVYSVGLGAHLRELSWPVAYLVLGAPTLVLLYAVGELLDRARMRDDDAV